MERQYFSSMIIATLTLSLGGVIGCSDAAFRGQTKKSDPQAVAALPGSAPSNEPSHSADASAAGAHSVTDEFELKSSSGKVDMIWAIDNSGSMDEEVAQVRSNFKKFLDSLAGNTDTHVALLSSAKGSLGIDAAAIVKGSNVKQISEEVGSNNALAMIASSLGKGFGSENSLDVMGHNRRYSGGQSVRAVAGSLASFPRSGAKLVIVIVTDDNAEGVDESNFLEALKADQPLSAPTVFSFSGLSSSPAHCEIADEGLAYQELASKTGGEVFDICSGDWSENFKKLGKQVAQLVSTSFKLKTADAVGVVKVEVDGVELPAKAYKFENGKVSIVDSSMVSAEAKKIAITYSVK